MKLLFRPLSLLLAAGLLGSCMVPLTTQDTRSPTVSNTETRLVFHTTPGNRAFVDQLSASNYLTLELRLLSDGTARSFATSTKDGNGDFVVTVPGLVAGDWRLRAFLYDSEASAQLQLYARQTVYLAPGQVRDDIVLALYEPSAPGSVDPSLALDAHHIVIDPQGSLYDQEVEPPRVIGTGSKTKLLATVYSNVVSTAPPPANPADVQPDEYDLAVEQGLSWTTSDPWVAVVSASGLVTALHAGKVAITATSVENKTVTQGYHFEVVPGIEGSWLSPKVTGGGRDRLYRIGNGRWTFFQWDTPLNEENTAVDPASLGRRGTYLIEGDRITLVTEGFLQPGDVEWSPVVEGSHAFDAQTYHFAVEGDSLALTQDIQIVRSPVLTDGDVPSGGVGLGFQGTRTAEVPLTTGQVNLNAWSLNSGLGFATATEGDVLDLSSTYTSATVQQLVWVSSDETKVKFRPEAGSYALDVSLDAPGMVILKAYSLDSLDYSGTFAANGPPPVIILTLDIQPPPV